MMTTEHTKNAAAASLGVVVKDDDLSAVSLRNRTTPDGTVWASMSAFMKEEQIADILDSADSNWEWTIDEMREIAVTQRWEREDATPKKGIMVVGTLCLFGLARMGVGYDTDPRSAATYAFKDAAQKWGVGRFLANQRYSTTVKFQDDATFKRFISRKPSWADVLALKQGER